MLIYIKAYFKRNLRYIESYTIYILIAFQKSMFFIPSISVYLLITIIVSGKSYIKIKQRKVIELLNGD